MEKKMETDRRDGKVSEGLMRFFDGLDREERDDLLEMLRDPKTFIAEDLDDLLAVLSSWGPCPVTPGCPADLDGSLDVDFGDLVLLLGAWGRCD